MDSRNLKSLMEAYASVYSPQEVEQVDENRAAMGRINKEYHRKKEAEEMAARSRDPKVKRDLPKRKNDNPMYDPKSAGSSRVKGFKFTGEEVEMDEAMRPGERQRKVAAKVHDPYVKGGSKTRAIAHNVAVRGDVKPGDPSIKSRGGGGVERDKGMGYGDRGAGNRARRRMGQEPLRGNTRKEELDIFDVVLEFLYVEGYVDTLEEAEWMMANLIDEEAIDIILGEEFVDEAITSEKGKAKAAEMIAKRTTASGRAKSGQGANVAQIKHISRANVDGYSGTPSNLKVAKNPVRSNFTGLNTGTGNKAARRAAALKKEEFEAWLDEAMSSYDRNRKRAAQRAAARNAARDAGKTGVVPGVGYVSPRRERETYTDEKGTVRHKSGAKMP